MIYDAVDVAAIPADAQMILAYIDGGYVTLPAVQQRFPNARILTVTTNGKNKADICDVESGDATPAIAGQGVAAGLYKTVYCALENKAAVFAACSDFNWYCAHPTGVEHLEPDSVATQWAWPGYGSPGNYDISVTNGVWPDAAPAPTPPPKETEMGIIAVPSNGQDNVFQVAGNALWHKWRLAGQTNWGNENVGVVAGPSAGASFPNQVPSVNVTGANIKVTVEDATGKAWWFEQDGAAWGVNELP